MNKPLKIAAIGTGLVAAALAGMSLHPPELLRVGSNYSAKIVCTNVFVAHRDPAQVLDIDVQAPGNPLLRLMKVDVDRTNAIVHANILGFIGNGIAVYRPGTGCAAVPDGDVAKARAQTYVPDPIAAAPADQDWPAGSRAQPNAAVARIIQDDRLAGPAVRGVAVISHGKLIAERYGAGFDAGTPLLGWSMTKSVNAVLVGMQVHAGKLALNQSHFWPAGAQADEREKITLADLLAMSSGLAFNENYGNVSDVTRMLYLEPDMAKFVHDKPLDHHPGEFWNYSTGTSTLLARIWMDATGAGPGAIKVPHDELFKPLGMASALIEVDESGTVSGGSYMYATVQDWARFAQFLLQDGVWNDRRMLPEGYVAMMHTEATPSHGKYGRGQVWMEGPEASSTTDRENADVPFHLPRDIFWMQGHDGQTIAIVPSLQLAVVRMGLTPDEWYYQPQTMVADIIKALAQNP